MTVKGKVENGIVKVIAVVEGRVIGYQRPLRHTETPVETPIVHTQIKPSIDSPFIAIAQSHHKQAKEEARVRLQALWLGK